MPAVQHGPGRGTSRRNGPLNDGEAAPPPRPQSHLEAVLLKGLFAVTAEVVPPRSADAAVVTEQARALVGHVDAANVTDNPAGAAHMSSVAGAALVAAAGVEPVLQLTTRDRNRLGLMSDVLGGWAVGARNLLCLSGDPPATDGTSTAKAVYDVDVVELVRVAATLRQEGRDDSGATFEPAPRFFVGVADLPLSPKYDFGRLERKLDAGARFVQTQIVYDVDAFGDWAESARHRGVLERAFVLVGVAPPRSLGSLTFMREHLPGVVVPDALIGRLQEAGPEAPAEGVRLTTDVVTRISELEGIAGVHVMGLGHEASVREVIARSGLLPRP